MRHGAVQAVKEVESLRAVVGNYEKDKAALSQSKARLLHSEKHLKHLEWENEVSFCCKPRTMALLLLFDGLHLRSTSDQISVK